MRTGFWQRAGMLGVTAALAGCGRPDLGTDLNTEGDPVVTLVAIYSDGAGTEVASYCGAENRNLSYCPPSGDVDPVADAAARGSYLRVTFDELLDPRVEDVEAGIGTLVATQPVNIICDDEAVDYDGFYDPSGNHLTFPAGPGLVITPLSLVASGAACTISIGSGVVDKDGNGVPADDAGPYPFGIAALRLVQSSPTDGATEIDVAVEIALQFNNAIDASSAVANVELSDANGLVAADVSISEDTPDLVEVTPTAGLELDTEYTVSAAAGLEDPKGGALSEAVSFSFTTNAASAQ